MWQVQDKGSQVSPPEGFQRSPGPAIQAVEPEPDQQAGWVDGVRDGLELGEGLDSLVKDHSLDVGAGFLVGHGMADQPPGIPAGVPEPCLGFLERIAELGPFIGIAAELNAVVLGPLMDVVDVHGPAV